MLKKILIIFLVVTLSIFDYFLFMDGLRRLLGYEVQEVLSIISPLLNLGGVAIAAATAIYVMNRNHEDSEKKIVSKEKREDAIEIKKSTILIGQILTLSGSLCLSYDRSKISHLNFQDLSVVKKHLEEIEEYCKEIIVINVHHDTAEYTSLIKSASKILNEVRTFQANHIIHHVKNPQDVSAEPFYQCFKLIQNNAYDYLITREDYTMFEHTKRI